MQKVLRFLLLIFTLVTVLPALAQPSPSPNGFLKPQCTWWVDNKCNDAGWRLIFSQSWGRDGRKWWDYVTNGNKDQTPRVGAIMCLDAWSTNEFGHVAYVIEVENSDRFKVSHSNWNGPYAEEMWFTRSGGSVRRDGGSWLPLRGFISRDVPVDIFWTGLPPMDRWYRSNEHLNYHLDGTDPHAIEMYDDTIIAEYNTRDGYVNTAAAPPGWHRYHTRGTNSMSADDTGDWWGGYDNAIPYLSDVQGPAADQWFTGSGTVTWWLRDDLSGPKRHRYRWNDGPWTDWGTNPVGADGHSWRPSYVGSAEIPEGTSSLDIEIEDSSWDGGNENGHIGFYDNVVTYKRDASAPSCDKPTTTASSPTNATNIPISFTGADIHSGIDRFDVYIDGGKVGTVQGNPATYNWNTSSASESSHSIYAVAYDAAGNASPQSASLEIKISRIAISAHYTHPSVITGGSSVLGRVNLSKAAPAGGLQVSLSDDSSAISTPASVVVPAGQTGVTYPIQTSHVSADVTRYITASWGGSKRLAAVTLKKVVISGLSISPTAVIGGLNSGGTVTINAPARPEGQIVYLKTDSSVVRVSPTVTMLGGRTSVSFTIYTGGVSADAVRHVTATVNGTSKTAAIKLLARYVLTGLTVQPSSIKGGSNATGTVTINKAAPSAGIGIALSDNSGSITTPPSVKVPSGASLGRFTITTTAVAATSTRSVTASFNGITKVASITLTP